MSNSVLEMLTAHFARPLGPRGIIVNTVAPRVVDTADEAFARAQLRSALARLPTFGRLVRQPHSVISTGVS